MNEMNWSSQDKIDRLSKEPYGEEFMTKVAKKLMSDPKFHQMARNHRDYCGHGLHFDGKRTFSLIEVWESRPGKVIKSWTGEKAFIAFMAKQSDFTMSGADNKAQGLSTGDPWKLNNQRITRRRMENFLSKQ